MNPAILGVIASSRRRASGTVVLLMWMSDGTQFTDLKGHAETVGGAPSISSAHGFSGGQSGLFTGPNTVDGLGASQRVTFADSADWHLGTRDFTFETNLYRTRDTEEHAIVGRQDGADTYGSFSLTVKAGGALQFACDSAANGSGWALTVVSAAGAVPANANAHVAVTRQGTTFKLWADGVEVASATSSINILAGSYALTVGANRSVDSLGAFGFTGYLWNTRMIVDAAEYTAAFTPPSALFPNN